MIKKISNKIYHPKSFFLIYLLFSLLCVTLCLSFILGTGFIGDDAYNSQINGVIISEGVSITNKFILVTKGWILGAGRFFPLHWYPIFFYHFTQSEIILKSLNILIIATGISILGMLIKDLLHSYRAGLVIVVISPALLQVRAWHDPILSFSSLIPLLFLYLSISLYYFNKYLNTEKIRFLWISLLFHAIGLLTYEATYLFFIIYLFIAIDHSKKLWPGILKSLPIIFLSFVVIGISILLKTKLNSDFNNTYPGANVAFNAQKIYKSFIIQLTAGLPLSYHLNTDLTTIIGAFKPNVLARSCAITLVFLLSIWGINTPPSSRHKLLVLIGACLIILPSLIMALSGHQDELIAVGYGYGYIPVYFEYFGYSIIFVISIIYLLGKIKSELLKKCFIFFIAAIIFSISSIHIDQTRVVSKNTNDFYLHPRLLLKNVLRDLDKSKIITSDAVVIRNPRYPHDQDWFFSMMLDRKMELLDVESIKPKLPSLIVGDRACYLWTRFSKESESEVVMKYEPIAKPFVTVANAPKNIEYWLVSYNSSRPDDSYLFLGRLSNIYANKETDRIYSIEVDKLFSYSHNSLKQIHVEKNTIDFLKIIETQNQFYTDADDENKLLNRFKSEHVYFDWQNIYPLEGGEINNVRWSSGSSKLAVGNFSNAHKKISMQFLVGTGYTDMSKFRILLNDKLLNSYDVNQTPKTISIDFDLAPGETSRFDFISSEKKFPNSDPRKMVFGIFDFKTKITEK